MTLQPRTITVFGGTGFLGRHIIWQLAKTGCTIRVATRNLSRAYFLRPAGVVGQVVPFCCDINNDASVALALQGADAAINLVGILYERGKSSFKRVHVEAAERIARQAKFANLELLVHLSAIEASLDAPSAYGRSKAQGEDGVMRAFGRAVILRPSIVFGPEDRVFNLFAEMARKAPFLPLISGGRKKFQPVYVGDIAKAIGHIFADTDTEKYQGKIYELRGPETYSFREMLEVMRKYTHQKFGFISLPAPIAKLLGAVLGLLPRPLLTVDQVRTLASDSVAAPGNGEGLEALGVAPTAIETILPSYLSQYWPGGMFAEKHKHAEQLKP